MKNVLCIVSLQEVSLLKVEVYIYETEVFHCPECCFCSSYPRQKGTVHHVVGDEKITVTMVLNKNLWLEINEQVVTSLCLPVTDLCDGIGCAHYNSCLYYIPATNILN